MMIHSRKVNSFQLSILHSLLLFLGFVGLQLAASDPDAACSTPTSARGLCVPVNRCTLVSQLRERHGDRIPAVFQNFIRKSACNGSESSYICCDVSFVKSDANATTTTATTNGKYQLNPKGLELLMGTKCGNTSEDKVAFGEKANIAEYPWMALLRYDTPDQDFLCGGSLITNLHVLTAAHCLDNRDKLIGVRLGEHVISMEIDCKVTRRSKLCAPPVEDYGYDKIIPHPDFDRAKKINDVGLIKLNRLVQFNWHITPICLPIIASAAHLADDQDFIVAGWGLTEKGPVSDVLMKAVVSKRPLEVCETEFRNYTLTENHICAGGISRTDACSGDSGGPLFFKAIYLGKTRYVQYGVVSYGSIKCGSERPLPGVYANAIYHLPWITNNLD